MRRDRVDRQYGWRTRCGWSVVTAWASWGDERDSRNDDELRMAFGGTASSDSCTETFSRDAALWHHAPMANPLVILGLLPDPAGRDRGRETVLLHNQGAAPKNLDGHWLLDGRRRRTDLTGQLAPWEERAWVLDGSGVLLTNRGGRLELHGPAGRLHEVVYGPSRPDEWIAVPPPVGPGPDGRWCVELLPERGRDGSSLPAVGTRDYLAALREMMWEPGDILTVGFMPDEGHPTVRENVERVAREWSEYANIAFDFVGDARPGPNGEVPQIRVGLRPGPAYSMLGRECEQVSPKRRTMNLGNLTTMTDWTELRRIVLHEFGHALGLIHEHQQPAAGIRWDEERVYALFGVEPFAWSRELVKKNILDRYAVDTTQFSEFDPHSIMLYPIPIDATLDGFSSAWNDELSSCDKAYVEELYPPDGDGTQTLVGDGTLIDVSFDRDTPTRRFALVVDRPGRFEVQTEGSLDTLLDIRREGAADVIRENDESDAPGNNARLDVELLPGRYVVRVWLYYPSATGVAQLFARRLSG